MTDGRGADVYVDAVGMEADPTAMDKLANAAHLQVGAIKALRMPISARNLYQRNAGSATRPRSKSVWRQMSSQLCMSQEIEGSAGASTDPLR
jgi:hypothetical protein